MLVIFPGVSIPGLKANNPFCTGYSSVINLPTLLMMPCGKNDRGDVPADL